MAASSDDFATAAVWRRIEQFVAADKDKTDLLKEMVLRYEQLSQKYQNERESHIRDIESLVDWQRDRQVYIDNYNQMQALLERDPFVLVLIDGDGMIFEDEFLRAGEVGGRKAAAAFYKALTEYIRTACDTIPISSRIVCRIYAHVRGLANVLVQAGIIQDASVFEDFVRGFTSSQSLFDFIDVGSGKDKADAKIAELFKLHLNDFHCRQMFLGCSHDNGYARLLENHVNDEMALPRVTLMEGVPFEKELRELPFATKAFPGLFRNTKISLYGSQPPSVAKNYNVMSGLPSRFPPPGTQSNVLDSPIPARVNLHLPRSPSASTLASNEGSPMVSAKPSPSLGWAAIAAKPAPPALVSSPIAYKPVDREDVIARNRFQQRVDPQTRDYDKAEVDRIKKIKMCNVHFLRRECPFGDECTHRHDYKPTRDEINTLRLVARMAPCVNGSSCDDVKCIYGHKCPAPPSRTGIKGTKNCIFGEQCKFPIELHDIDCNVVKTLVVR